MKRSSCLVLVCLILAIPGASARAQFRSGIFLHHSTGGCIWGPNGGSVTVPDEIAKYNTEHGFAGPAAVTLSEQWWPSGDNEWNTWHGIFDGQGGQDDIGPILASNKIVMIKSCFPSANMWGGEGNPGDTSSPGDKSIANYKWHWRSIVSRMRSHPQNFFVLWTNAPNIAGATNDAEASASDRFCRWAKDTLAAGGDPSTGAFPKNVYVFDFFHHLADAAGKLPSYFSAGDSHPNDSATAVVAPHLVREIFDAALAYEGTLDVAESGAAVPERSALLQNYPNPFNPATTIRFNAGGADGASGSPVRLAVYDLLGREVAVLADGIVPAGEHAFVFDAKGCASGTYVCRLTSGGAALSIRMMLVR
jgi:hypothetical protein